MKLRTVLIEEEKPVRELLKIACRLRDHEVLAISSPTFCAVSDGTCTCDENSACCDLIIVGETSHPVGGMEYIEQLRRSACLVPNVALVTAGSSDELIQRARRLGCHLIEKPLRANVLFRLLQRLEDNAFAKRRRMPDLRDAASC